MADSSWLNGITGPDILSGSTPLGRQPNLSFDPFYFQSTSDPDNLQNKITFVGTSLLSQVTGSGGTTVTGNGLVGNPFVVSSSLTSPLASLTGSGGTVVTGIGTLMSPYIISSSAPVATSVTGSGGTSVSGLGTIASPFVVSSSLTSPLAVVTGSGGAGVTGIGTSGNPYVVSVSKQTTASLFSGINVDIPTAGYSLLQLNGALVTASFQVGGFALPGNAVPVGGQSLFVQNTTNQPMTILHEDTHSTAANRIDTQTSASVQFAPGHKATVGFVYDATEQRWVLQNSSVQGASGLRFQAGNPFTIYIDGQNTTGNASDSNAGTITAPFLTAQGLYNAWRSGAIDGMPRIGNPVGVNNGTINIQMLSACKNNDPVGILGHVILGKNISVTVTGPTATTQATGSVLSVTPLNRIAGTVSPWIVSSSVDFTGFIGSTISNTTRGTQAYIMNTANAGHAAVCSQFVVSGPGQSFPTLTATQAGDVFSVVTYPTQSFGGTMQPLVLESAAGQVCFYRINFGGVNSQSILVNPDRNAYVVFSQCQFDAPQMYYDGGNTFIINCLYNRANTVGAGPIVRGGTAWHLAGGNLASPAQITGGGAMFDCDYFFAPQSAAANGNIGVITVGGEDPNGGFFTGYCGLGNVFLSGAYTNGIYVGPNSSLLLADIGGYPSSALYGTTVPVGSALIFADVGSQTQYQPPSTSRFGYVGSAPLAIGPSSFYSSSPSTPATAYSVSDLSGSVTFGDVGITSRTGASITPQNATSVYAAIASTLPGAAIFGDGSDGDANVVSGSSAPPGMVANSAIDFSLTRDVFYRNALISQVTLHTNNFKLRCAGSLRTLVSTITVAGTDAVSGSAGVAVGAGTLAGGTNGGAGGVPVAGVGGAGGTIVYGLPNTITGSGTGAGGAGNGAAGAAPSFTMIAGGGGAHASPELGMWAIPVLSSSAGLPLITLTPIQGGVGGAGGGGGTVTGVGGGGGGGGGNLFIAARTIANPVIGTSVLSAAGGAGAPATNIGADIVGGGGGGGGGNVILIAEEIVGLAHYNISAGGGIHGNGSGGNNGKDGLNGTVLKVMVLA